MTVWVDGLSFGKVDYYVDFYKLTPDSKGVNSMVPHGTVCIDCYPEHVKERETK